MQARLDAHAVAPEAFKPMMALEAHVRASGLEHSLLHLIKTRASQLNGCAYCVDMHAKEARADGETEQRLYMLSAWRESPAYSARERAALAWTEALTLLAESHAPDEVYEAVTAEFSQAEVVNLILAIATINAWNRFGVGFRLVHPVA